MEHTTKLIKSLGVYVQIGWCTAVLLFYRYV